MKFLLSHIQALGYPSFCISHFSFDIGKAKLLGLRSSAACRQTLSIAELDPKTGSYALYSKETYRTFLEVPTANTTTEKPYSLVRSVRIGMRAKLLRWLR